MHKRTLSGSEQLAHSKNRHEERHLKERLEQLAYSEFQSRDQNRVETQKWRQFLRDNNKTSGWSPMAMRPDTDEQNDFFDFSARFDDGCASPTSPRRHYDLQLAEKFQRPWAYTFNSESHNKVYRELALAGENSKKMHKVVSPTGSGAAPSGDYPRLAQHVAAVTGLERARSAWSHCSDRMLPARSVQIPPRPRTSAEETCFVEYSDLTGSGTDSADASPRFKLERQVSKLSSVTRAKSAWIRRDKNSSQLNESDERPATVGDSRGDHIPKLARSVTMLSGLCKSRDIWICSVCGGDTREEKDKEKFAYTALVYKGLQKAKSVLERLKSPTDTKDSGGEEKTEEEERPSTPRANRCSCGCKKSKGNISLLGSALVTPRSRQSKGKINTQGVPNSTRLQTGMSGKNKSNETPRNSPRQVTNKKPILEKCRSISVTNMGAKESSFFGKKISLPATVNNSWSEINGRLKEDKGNCKDAFADVRERKISQTQCNKICETPEIISNGNTESASIQNKQRFSESPKAKALISEDGVINKIVMTAIDTQQESSSEISAKAGNSPVAQRKSDCGGENSLVHNIPDVDAKTVSYQQVRNQCEENSEKITGSGLSEELSGRPECQTFGQRKTDGSIDSSKPSEKISPEQSNQGKDQTVARKKDDSKCVKGTEGTSIARLENRSEIVDPSIKEDIMKNISDVLRKKVAEEDEAKDKVGSGMKLYRGRPAGSVGRRSTTYSTSEMVVFIKRVRNKVKDKQLRREDNVFYKIARVMLEKQKVLRAERAAAAAAAKANSDADAVGRVTSGEDGSSGDRKPSTTTAPVSGSTATGTRNETMQRSVSVTQDKADTSANHSNGCQGNSNNHKPDNVNNKNDRRVSSENSKLNYTKIQDIDEDNENQDSKNNNNERNRKISTVNNNNDNVNCNNTYLTRSTSDITNYNANGRRNEVITETDTYNNDDTESVSLNMASIIRSIENQSKTNGADGNWANSDLKGLFSNRFTEHKGVKIRNYVSPHLRYKTAARDRQRREVSVRWHVSEGAMVTSHQYQDRPKSSGVVFPKHARLKALAKMVEENHAQPISNAAQLADAELRRRIDQFLTSVEPYCQSPRE